MMFPVASLDAVHVHVVEWSRIGVATLAVYINIVTIAGIAAVSGAPREEWLDAG